ncbi:MAG TPA: hypothetical protein VFC65_01190 [Prolixibacteraceae bacterium]|nr:hypothetical protein [Prolixibacteraceae bacterium]
MYKIRKGIILLTMLAGVILLVNGCGKDDNPTQNTTYSLNVTDVLGVNGRVTFTETSNTTTTIDIVLINATSGIHPANLYMYSAVEDGVVVQTLNPVDESGRSTTLVTTMSYRDLIAFDGCIRVLQSNSEPEVILAQGDIGGNEKTTTSQSYTLSSTGVYGVSGTALFEKRVNGNTLVTISLSGTIDNGDYPATINLGSITSVDEGTIRKTLNHVDGTTGKSLTNIRKLDSGISITYTNWLEYLGYINILQSPTSGTIICHGNIGSLGSN